MLKNSIGSAVFGATFAVSALSPAAPAQCGAWLPGFGLPGVQGSVFTTTVWDPDGPGPAPPALVLGGEFDFAGMKPAGHIAAFDGSNWLNVGSLGASLGHNVRALEVYNGDLIAGGLIELQDASRPYAARWTGSSWAPLGDAVGSAFAFAIFQGELIAAGSFGSSDAPYIRRWDGSSWRPLGLGMDSTVFRLAVLGDQLIAEGQFTTAGGVPVNGLASWNGSSWSRLDPPAGVNPRTIVSLAVHDALLFAGTMDNSILRWNSSAWLSPLTVPAVGQVTAITFSSGELIAAVTNFHEFNSNWMFAYDGASWRRLGAAFKGGGSGDSSSISAVHSWAGQLIASGLFKNASGAWLQSVARWDGASWRALDPGALFSDVSFAFAEYDGDAIAVGDFTGLPGPHEFSRWNGAEWAPVGETHFHGTTTAMAAYHGDLFVGGVYLLDSEFSFSNKIERWDGAAWQPFALPVSGAGAYAMTVQGDRLIVASDSHVSGQTPKGRILAWDGASWQALGEDMDWLPSAVTVFNGDLIVAGGFQAPFGQPMEGRVARWNGATWQSLGLGMNKRVSALAVYAGALYAGGAFATADGAEARSIARWDGASWKPVGAGIDGSVAALASFHGELIAAGAFAHAGGADASNIARWNGGVWRSFGAGTDDNVLALSIRGNDLLLRGNFHTAGGQPSVSLALWRSCSTDIDADGVVGAGDLQILLGAWGDSNSPADLDSDGLVGSSDLSLLLGAWGSSG